MDETPHPSREVRYIETHADENKIKLLIAGGASAAISRTVVSPLYRVSVLYQVQNMKNAPMPDSYKTGILPTIRAIIQNGKFGLYKGNWTHMVKKVPFSAIKFLSYEYFKQKLTPSNKKETGNREKIIAGVIAALIAITGTYPLDLVQTHLTVQTNQNSKYKGILQTISTISREEGIKQLYRGVGITILSSAPGIALNMVLWEKLKDSLNHRIYGESNDHRIHPFVSAFCGSISGTISSTLTFPMDVVRKHMQLNHKILGQEQAYSGYLDAFAKILKRDGIRGFYRGIGSHYLTIIPNVAIAMGSYDGLKLLFKVT